MNQIMHIDLVPVMAPYRRDAAAARFKRARQRAGFKTPREFAEGCGFNPTTCGHHENGQRALTCDSAAEYARYLGVTPAWILYGEASQHSGVCRIVGTVGDQSKVTLFTAREGQRFVEVPGSSENYDIITVTDTSLEPFASAGNMLYFQPPLPLSHFDRADIDGKYCVVYLDGDVVEVRKVIVQTDELATLLTWDNCVVAMGVPVRRISPIEWVRKMRVKSSAAQAAA